jgi:hypothetical protein
VDDNGMVYKPMVAADVAEEAAEEAVAVDRLRLLLLLLL